MKISQMIKQLGGDITAIAKKAGITPNHLRKMKSVGSEVEQLPNGDYIVVRKDAVRFKQ